MKNLTQLPLGSSGRVIGVAQDSDRRMWDMGLVEGTTVQSLFRSPLGDPTAYLVRGAVIALRKKDAARVLIEEK